jgi:hypothetical protein
MRTRGPFVVAAALFVAFIPMRSARADQNYFSVPAYLESIAPLAVLPSEVGVVVQPSETNFAFGWSWQVPFDRAVHHRVVGDVDLLVRSSGVSSARGRIGYRHGERHVFVGGGVGRIPDAFTLSPELGVKFAHGGTNYGDGLDTSLHAVVRADLAPTTGQISGMLLFGWNLF